MPKGMPKGTPKHDGWTHRSVASIQSSRKLTARDKMGVQPIHDASALGQLDLIQWLARQPGVSLASTCGEGRQRRQPIHLACLYGHLAVVEWLAQQDDVSLVAAVIDGRQPIHAACGHGQLTVARWLAMQDTVSLVATANSGGQPIHAACESGKVIMMVRSRYIRHVLMATLMLCSGWQTSQGCP